MAIRDLSNTDDVSAPAGNDAWDAAFAPVLTGSEFSAEVPVDAIDVVVDATQLDDAGSSAGASDGRPETPQSTPASDAGATPVAAAPAPATTTDGTPPSAPAVPEPEPVPFTFTVNGKEESLGDAMLIPGDGLYVPEKDVPHIKLLASQAKTLDAQVRAERTQREEQSRQWERLSTWTTKDAQGQEHTLTGPQALEAERSYYARAEAGLGSILKALTPEEIVNLVDYVKVDAAGNKVPWETPDAQIVAIRHEANYKALMERASFAADQRAFAVKQRHAELQKPAPPPEPTAASFADGTIATLAEQHGFSALTPADKQVLAQHFETYTRPATPEERKQYGVSRLVLPSFVELMKDRNAIRAEMVRVAQEAQTKTAAVAAVAPKVGKFNGGMDKGRAASAAPVRAPAPAAAAPAEGKFAPRPKTTPSGNDLWGGLVAEAQQIATG